MKKSNKIFWGTTGSILAILLVMTTSFRVFGSSDNNAAELFTSGSISKKIIGNGNIANKSITATEFDTINIGGQFDVTVNPGKQNTANLTTDENILPYVIMSASNNALNISVQPGIWVSPSQTQKTLITAQTLHNINLSGETTLHAMNINSDYLALTMGGKSLGYLQGNIKKMQINLRGKSELHVALGNEEAVNLNIGGDGIVYLSGKVKNLTITTGGQATVLAKDLIADDVKITGAGESNITINATKSLSVLTAGESNINYYGNPTISKTSFGEVNLEKMHDVDENH